MEFFFAFVVWYAIGLLGSWLAFTTLNNRYPNVASKKMKTEYYLLALLGLSNLIGAWAGLGGFTLTRK